MVSKLPPRWSSRMKMEAGPAWNKIWRMSTGTRWEATMMTTRAFQSTQRPILTKKNWRPLSRASRVARANSTKSCNSRHSVRPFRTRTKSVSLSTTYAMCQTRKPARNLQRLKIESWPTASARLIQSSRKRCSRKDLMTMERMAQVTSCSQFSRKWTSAISWSLFASGTAASQLVIIA